MAVIRHSVDNLGHWWRTILPESERNPFLLLNQMIPLMPDAVADGICWYCHLKMCDPTASGLGPSWSHMAPEVLYSTVWFTITNLLRCYANAYYDDPRIDRSSLGWISATSDIWEGRKSET